MSDEIEVVVDPGSAITDGKIRELLNLVELDRQRRVSTELKLAEALTEIRIALACLGDAGNTMYSDLLQAADDLKKYRTRCEAILRWCYARLPDDEELRDFVNKLR